MVYFKVKGCQTSSQKTFSGLIVVDIEFTFISVQRGEKSKCTFFMICVHIVFFTFTSSECQCKSIRIMPEHSMLILVHVLQFNELFLVQDALILYEVFVLKYQKC